MGSAPTFRFYSAMEKLKDEIQALFGSDFILLDLKADVHAPSVRIIVDSEAPITVDTTVRLTKLVKNSGVLEEQFPTGCRLEVSSPGVGTPLILPFQYRKNIGRTLSVRYQVGPEEKTTKGKLTTASDAGIGIAVAGENLELAYADIVHAVVVVSFK